MASDEAYGAVLDDADRRALVDDPADALGDVLDIVGEALALVCATAQVAVAELGATRIPPTSEAAAASVYPQIARALAGPQTLLYAVADGPDLQLVTASPPVIVLGPRFASERARSQHDAVPGEDAELRFRLGRVVELARPRRLLARLAIPLWQAFGGGEPTAEAEKLRSVLPVAMRRRIAERIVEPDVDAYLAGCERAADRAGLLACGDVAIAIALAGGPARARHLVELAASKAYLATRKKLRPRRG
jgi:hypothetical protein